jgi:hypothetical protein
MDAKSIMADNIVFGVPETQLTSLPIGWSAYTT